MKSSRNPENARNPGKLEDLKISAPAKKAGENPPKGAESPSESVDEFLTPARKEIVWNALQRIVALAKKNGDDAPISEVFDKLRERNSPASKPKKSADER